VVEIEYAKALHELALEENKVDIFWDAFIVVNNASNIDEFQTMMVSPLLEKDEKKKIIDNVYNKLDKTFVDFLYVLIDHNRFNLLKGIAHEYRKLVRIDKNIMFIDIISAQDLTEAQLNKVKKMLKEKYNDKVLDFKYIIKPDLIGGIQIISNGESIDLSLKASLDKIKEGI